ncbi:enterotoxin A family protein [Paraburkholderia sp. GAS348]|uniref:enterotoxin A family protein n=1 Tax=Paraburkholderia sp. GAS348 TaxID=3035132 RepID=UPI003D2542F7
MQHLLAPLANETARSHLSPESRQIASPDSANDQPPQRVRTRRGGRLPPTGVAGLPPEATQVPYRGAVINLRPSAAPNNSPEVREHYATFDSMYRPSYDSRAQVTADRLAPAAGPNVPRDFGTTMATMATAAINSVPHGSNLLEAAAEIYDMYANGGTDREHVLTSIEGYHHDGEWNGDARELAHYIRHPGAAGLENETAVVDDLARHFSTPYNPHGEAMGHPETFALIGYAPVNDNIPGRDNWSPSVVFAVQRLHTTGDYRNDRYALYSPYDGAFLYENFNQLAYAISNTPLNEPDTPNPVHAYTSYYAMQNVLQHPMAEERLGDIGGSYGMPALPTLRPQSSGGAAPPMAMPSLTPPRADLPPPPDFDQPGPSGYQPRPRDDLKRSADTEGERQPMALYRPSIVTPAELKKLGRFSAEQTPLGKVNLDLHNFDVATNPSVIDGAGYLGTFRKLETAQQNPALVDAKNGYVYAVAPTPNMVDVNASLSANARNPDTGEVAAMGRIDYTQIRGWQKMENGKLGKFTANPDYRWDVYDQTRTAGAQPQLSRFAADNPAWSDSAHRPFATTQTHNDTTTYVPTQEPNLTQATFYNHALEKIGYLNDQQAKGQDYRGPVELIAHNGAYGTLQANVHTPAGQLFSPNGPGNTDVTVTNRAADVGGYHTFRMGDDGRFHTKVLGEDEVLRVGSDGFLNLDYAPKDPQNRNGVFRYQDNRLVHEEDHKVLTYSNAGYAYVSDHDYDSSYSQWKLTGSSNKSYAPPKSIYSYHDNSAGSARTQYEFDKDPDLALPTGATHFVTSLPGGPSTYEDTGSFIRNATQDQQQERANWLNRNNAALLFKDGFYLTATGEHTLEVRNLQGNTIKTVQTDAASQNDASGIKSDYSISDRTWSRLQSEQDRRKKFEELSTTAYAAQ